MDIRLKMFVVNPEFSLYRPPLPVIHTTWYSLIQHFSESLSL